MLTRISRKPCAEDYSPQAYMTFLNLHSILPAFPICGSKLVFPIKSHLTWALSLKFSRSILVIHTLINCPSNFRIKLKSLNFSLKYSKMPSFPPNPQYCLENTQASFLFWNVLCPVSQLLPCSSSLFIFITEV